jgi:hypothetical protein
MQAPAVIHYFPILDKNPQTPLIAPHDSDYPDEEPNLNQEPVGGGASEQTHRGLVLHLIAALQGKEKRDPPIDSTNPNAS